MKNFEEAKKDFLHQYGNSICEEARVEVERSTNIKQAFAVLHKYSVYLTDRNVPEASWLRKWFADDLKTLNDCGVYLDQHTILHNPDYSIRPKHVNIVCCGESEIMFVLDKTEFFHITTQDAAVAKVLSREWSVCHLTAKDKSRGILLMRGENAKFKMRRV